MRRWARARASLKGVVTALEMAVAGGVDAASLLDRHRQREIAAQQYVKAYRHYCWPVNSVADLKLAPFHLLATEGKVHVSADHTWHMNVLAEICKADPALLLETPYKVIDVTEANSQAEGIRWWEELTGSGGKAWW